MTGPSDWMSLVRTTSGTKLPGCAAGQKCVETRVLGKEVLRYALFETEI